MFQPQFPSGQKVVLSMSDVLFSIFHVQMTMEIDIHRSLDHMHVVGFHGFFEDKDHVYILLELCRRRSLMELHKRRKALTEPEVRYYLRQTLLAVKYLHDVKVSRAMLHCILSSPSFSLCASVGEEPYVVCYRGFHSLETRLSSLSSIWG